jgi:hypothetical protein
MPTTLNVSSGRLWGANPLTCVRTVPLAPRPGPWRWPRKRHLAPTRNE